MKNGLNIFCNNNIKIFLNSLLSEYELTIMKLDAIKDGLEFLVEVIEKLAKTF